MKWAEALNQLTLGKKVKKVNWLWSYLEMKNGELFTINEETKTKHKLNLKIFSRIENNKKTKWELI